MTIINRLKCTLQNTSQLYLIVLRKRMNVNMKWNCEKFKKVEIKICEIFELECNS